jgi:vacuolar-type H+-ATPase subunit I/STV1
MNKERRRQLADVRKAVADARAVIETSLETFSAVLVQAKSDLEAIKVDEEDSMERLPESMRDGEKGQSMQECIETIDLTTEKLEEIDTALTQIKDDCDEVDSNIEQAMG